MITVPSMKGASFIYTIDDIGRIRLRIKTLPNISYADAGIIHNPRGGIVHYSYRPYVIPSSPYCYTAVRVMNGFV